MNMYPFFVDKIIDTNSDINFLDMKFHQNGKELWLMSKNCYITVIGCGAKQWHVLKAVSPERYYVKMSSFLSTDFAEEAIRMKFNSLWIGVSSTGKLVFLSENNTDGVIDLKSFLPWQCSAVKRFSISPDNKLLALISSDGTLKLYSIEFLLRQIFQTIQPKLTAIDHEKIQLNRNLNTLDSKVIFTKKAIEIVR